VACHGRFQEALACDLGGFPCVSEMESVTEFGVDFTGIVVVEAAEGQAVVEENAAIADVESVKADSVFLANRNIVSVRDSVERVVERW